MGGEGGGSPEAADLSAKSGAQLKSDTTWPAGALIKATDEPSIRAKTKIEKHAHQLMVAWRRQTSEVWDSRLLTIAL